MFCGNCGTQNADNAAFCKNCGSKLNTAQPQQPVYPQQYYAAPGKPLNKKLIGIIAGGAAAVILVVVLLIVLLGGTSAGGSTPEAGVGNAIEAKFDGDAGDLLKQLPDEVVAYLAEDEGYDSVDEMIDDLEKRYEANLEGTEQMYKGGLDMGYEIRRSEELEAYELEGLQERYEEEFGLKVTAASCVNALLTIKLEGITIDQSSTSFYVVEIDGTWYLDAFNFAF